MSKLFYGSICLTDILDKAKQKHEAFSKAKNGKIYVDISVWLNDEPDKYGNVMSVQVNAKEKGNRLYIGNLKPAEPKAPEPLTDDDATELEDLSNDLPFF